LCDYVSNPESGIYKLWFDFKPKGGKQTLVTFLAILKASPLTTLEYQYMMEYTSKNPPIGIIESV
jgi:hypothetical protein